jgi:hypothetical protein
MWPDRIRIHWSVRLSQPLSIFLLEHTPLTTLQAHPQSPPSVTATPVKNGAAQPPPPT